MTFPGAYELVLTLILGIGGLLAVTYGAAIGGSEWGWGTLKAAVARGESRTRYSLVNYAAVAVFVIARARARVPHRRRRRGDRRPRPRRGRSTA